MQKDIHQSNKDDEAVLTEWRNFINFKVLNSLRGHYNHKIFVCKQQRFKLHETKTNRTTKKSNIKIMSRGFNTHCQQLIDERLKSSKYIESLNKTIKQ